MEKRLCFVFYELLCFSINFEFRIQYFVLFLRSTFLFFYSRPWHGLGEVFFLEK